MQKNEMKKASDPSLYDCANCGTVGATLTCAKCKATRYCSKACQKQHWKNGHKALCLTPEERRPHMKASQVDESDRRPTVDTDAENHSGECSICLNSFSGGTLCTLPCKHDFHKDCVEELRKQGVQQACPLCRIALPIGPGKLFEDAARIYARIAARHRAEGGVWKPQTVLEEKNMGQVLDMWTNAANQGYLIAQKNLAVVYGSGQGVVQDNFEVVRWCRKAADQGDAGAQCNLGDMLCTGQGVAQDYYEAVQWYRKAADQGYADAQFNLGYMYDSGQGVAQDSYEAVRCYRKAADQGDVYAQTNLGTMYHHGQGVAQDLYEAAQWYRRAADQGNVNAQFNLGNMYDSGQGVAQDSYEAVRWYREAADQGDAGAQCNLGAMLCTGQGVAQNYEKGVQWYRRAADQGLADAQFVLGNCYYMGKEVSQDLKLAHFLFLAAEAQGYENAHELRKQVEATIYHTSSECPGFNLPPSNQCSSCGHGAENGVQLSPCPRCKEPLYCGKDCQRAHWKGGHKECCIKK